jgi:hypothetical protein
MRYFLTSLVLVVASVAHATNGQDGMPIEENFQTCTHLDCGVAVVNKFHTDQRNLTGPTVFGETFYTEEGSSNVVRTMFAPTKVRLVYNPATGQIFKPMTDYIPTKEGIKLTPGSAIKRAPHGYSSEITEGELKNYGVRLTTGFQEFQYAITYDKVQRFAPKQSAIWVGSGGLSENRHFPLHSSGTQLPPAPMRQAFILLPISLGTRALSWRI